MDWMYLKTFYYAATLKNLGKAAAVMHRSQPAVSKQIKALENSLGCQLFTRLNSRNMVLTEEGQRVLQFTEDVFQRRVGLMRELESLRNGEAGRVTLAAGTATLSLMLPDAMERFRERYPSARLTLLERSPDVALDMLSRGKIDLTLALESQVPAHLTTYHWKTAHFVLMVPRGHELTRCVEIRLEDVARFPIIKLASHVRFASGTKLEQTFAEQGLSMNVFLEARNIYLMGEYVRRGFGVSLVTSLAGGIPLFRDELEFLPLDHLFSPERILICTRRNSSLSPCARSLLEVLLEEGEENVRPFGEKGGGEDRGAGQKGRSAPKVSRRGE